jgi:uncharacterized repeat protein (TIGR02543 family)
MITFDSLEGNEIEPIKVQYGSEIVLLVVPTKEGYTFSGWQEVIPTSMPAENLIFTATWEINTYQITLNGYEENQDLVMNGVYNSNIEFPQNPLKTGFIFDGWYEDQDLKKDFTLLTYPAKDITLYAKWKHDTSSLEYKLLVPFLYDWMDSNITIDIEDLKLESINLINNSVVLTNN